MLGNYPLSPNRSQSRREIEEKSFGKRQILIRVVWESVKAPERGGNSTSTNGKKTNIEHGMSHFEVKSIRQGQNVKDARKNEFGRHFLRISTFLVRYSIFVFFVLARLLGHPSNRRRLLEVLVLPIPFSGRSAGCFSGPANRSKSGPVRRSRKVPPK